jgi:hypothetical protein
MLRLFQGAIDIQHSETKEFTTEEGQVNSEKSKQTV